MRLVRITALSYFVFEVASGNILFSSSDTSFVELNSNNWWNI